jgi:hypothetical protein
LIPVNHHGTLPDYGLIAKTFDPSLNADAVARLLPLTASHVKRQLSDRFLRQQIETDEGLLAATGSTHACGNLSAMRDRR